MAKVLYYKDRKGRYDQLLYTKHYYIGAERIAARTGSLEQMGYYPTTQLSAAMPKLGIGFNFSPVQDGIVSTTSIGTNTSTSQTDATAYVIQKVFDKFVPQTQRPALVNKATITLTSTNHVSTPANPILSYYFHPDHLGSSSYMSGNGGSILQHMEYLPFGEAMMDEHINSRNNPFKYNGKHLDEETGNYYYGARYYEPKLSNFISVDPLAEKTMSPYGYCYNNPIRFTDPTGMESDDIIITGKEAKAAFKQLQASTNYKLSLDKKTGKVTAGDLKKGTTATAADNKLKDATTDSNITVKINATDSNFTDSGNWFVGGAYDGSKVNADGTVTANQTVNPKMTKEIDKFYGADKGTSMIHEVIEAYIGAQDSPGLGAPTFTDVQNNTPVGAAYLNAHKKTDILDPRHKAPNSSYDPNKGVYISKFPYGTVPSKFNPEKLINNLKKK